MKKILAVAVAVIFLLTGCTEAKIDASDEQSIQKVRQSLTTVEQKKFDKAIQIMMFKNFDIKNIMQGGQIGSQLEISKAMQAVDGMTAMQVINEAINHLENNIYDLEQEMTIAKEQRSNFSEEIKLSNVRWVEKETSYYPVKALEFNIQNDSNQVISRVELTGIYKDLNRELPWSEIFFDESIPGGLIEGENRKMEIELRLVRYKGMKINEVPDDALFSLIVAEAYNNEGKKLFKTNNFSNKKQKIAKLKENLQMLK